MIGAALLKTAAPYAIAAVIGTGWYAGHNANQRAIGARDVLLHQDQLTIAALEETAKYQRVQYKTDTLRLTVVRSRWDTLTQRFHDTTSVVVHDTTPVPVIQVREIVRAGDSTQAACGVVVASCESRLATAGQELATTRAQLGLVQSAVPSAFRQWTTRVAWAVGGFGLGWIARR